MADIIPLYPNKGPAPDMEFEFEEEEEESIFIDPVKLQRELARIKATNPDAEIIILGDPDIINPKDVEFLMDAAQRIKDESYMIEFEDEEEE